ncbi:MAG: hypothetical protein WC832_06695 [Anaerolineales bacterium]
MNPIEKAKSTLVWYFRMLAQKAGIHWSGENEYEVENVIDETLRAARMETDEKIKALQEQIEAMQGRLARIEAAANPSAE